MNKFDAAQVDRGDPGEQCGEACITAQVLAPDKGKL
jgi:hypothetical protein